MIDGLPLELFRMRLGSAHVMGGCALGEDPRQAVCDSLGRHHQLENLSIHDGSLFPTSIGANPQLSVYALAARLSEALVGRLAQGHDSPARPVYSAISRPRDLAGRNRCATIRLPNALQPG
jgi:choline dehydrogenase-like flavoprotein